MIGSMFSGTLSTSKDLQGNYFIDRDGEMFRYILNFLRTSHLDLPNDFQELDLLSREADFYQIQPLLEALQKIKSPVTKIKKNVMLNIIHDSQFLNVGSGSIKVVNIRAFSTSCALLKLLNSKFYYGDKVFAGSNLENLKFISLEWFESNTSGMQSWKSLHVSPSHQQIKNLEMFVQQVIKIAVDGGFLLHSIPSVLSNPVILNFTLY
ncbi:BTB/POZ domain-containing protein KCTD21-like [Heterodontus francisci]|uniref:BTB/POZ domain-containing protein KCTD21-like n=1 Tax=Heterodontus francisci TaxID=7792 RepID=UPI00355C7E3B